MPHSYPGSGLNIEQLVYALLQAVGEGSPYVKQLLESGSQKILEIERDLSEISRATKVIENMLRPINKLPPEVLSAVMENCTPDRDLIAATQVCQYWRSVLTSNRVLWTSFRLQSSRGLDRALTYLERSNPMLIDLTVNGVPLRSLKVFGHLTANIARTRSFVVEDLRDGHTLSSLLRNPTPSLQHLDIDFRGAPERLPNDFLLQQASSLQSIRLINICPTFESPFPLPNLVQFRLRLLKMPCLFPTSALFRFLSAFPQLRKVLVHFSEETLKDIAPDQVISM